MKLKLLNRPTTPSRNIPGSPPEQPREQCIKEMVAAAPESCRKILQDAFDGTASKRRAIQAGCLACTHYDRKTISECRVFRCPLWKYRPYQDQEKDA